MTTRRDETAGLACLRHQARSARLQARAIKPLADVLASTRTEVAWTTLEAAEEALYVHHPEFESVVLRWNLIYQNLSDCGERGAEAGIQPSNCGYVVWQDYLLYRTSGVEEAFSTTVLAYQWALGLGIDKTWLDGHVTKLVQG